LQDAGGRIAGLRIFGMGDELERKDAILSAVYPASLLYFVSGVLEDDRDMPLLGMERYYGPPYERAGFEDLAYVREFDFLKRQRAFAWSNVTGNEGANCDMSSHGGWIQSPQTLNSVLYIVRSGYGYA
jgi:hypothetical protein